MISLSAVADRLRDRGLLADPVPDTDVSVSGITDDSRRLGPGELFCAVPGHRHDGHRFLDQAVRAGAAAALVESPRADLDVPQLRVTDARRATAIAAQAVYGDPARDLRLIGVTGTNGKTTTVHLIRHLVSARHRTGSLGTLGRIGPAGDVESLDLTTPGPVQLARALATLRDEGAGVVVLEVSSHALAQSRVDGVEFDVAAFTNVSRDHLDYHADFEEYRATKARLSDRVKDDGVLVVNLDEPAWSILPDRHTRLGYGRVSEADYRAENVESTARGSRWTLVTPEGCGEVELPLPGDFNVDNALAAAATASTLEIPLERLVTGLSQAPPVPGRLEVLLDAPLVLRDYAHTPEALRRALAAVRPLTDGRTIVVFGCGGERDPGKRPLMGRVAAEGADFIIVTSDNPRHEVPNAIIAEIIPGLGDAEFEVLEDRRAAIQRALELAGQEDLVLLAGKGHETYQIVGDERRPFDEAVVVERLMAERREA